ncbi:MAG: HdeD family acid-resistance protein, partial [Halothece sp.]
QYFLWKLLLGLLYLLAGVVVLSSPIITALTLTLILGISIFIQSVIEVFGAFQMRPDRGWGWVLFSGIVGIILGIFIWSEWPSSAIWFLGVWFGVNFLSDGIGLLMHASRVRSALPNA